MDNLKFFLLMMQPFLNKTRLHIITTAMLVK